MAGPGNPPVARPQPHGVLKGMAQYDCISRGSMGGEHESITRFEPVAANYWDDLVAMAKQFSSTVSGYNCKYVEIDLNQTPEFKHPIVNYVKPDPEKVRLEKAFSLLATCSRLFGPTVCWR